MNKNVCYYHVRYSEVKLGYINSVSTAVAAPRLIQPSVAIETGLVFQSAQQLELEEKKKKKKTQFKIFMGVPVSVCMH